MQALKGFLQKHGHTFYSDTDTEVIPKLCQYVFESMSTKMPFSELVMEVMKQLEGAYALLVKSTHYPGELVACKRGSPLILGIKENPKQLKLRHTMDAHVSPKRHATESLEVLPPSFRALSCGGLPSPSSSHCCTRLPLSCSSSCFPFAPSSSFTPPSPLSSDFSLSLSLSLSPLSLSLSLSLPPPPSFTRLLLPSISSSFRFFHLSLQDPYLLHPPSSAFCSSCPCSSPPDPLPPDACPLPSSLWLFASSAPPPPPP